MLLIFIFSYIINFDYEVDISLVPAIRVLYKNIKATVYVIVVLCHRGCLIYIWMLYYANHLVVVMV